MENSLNDSAIKPQAIKVKKCYTFALDAYAGALEKSENAVRYVNNESWSQSELTAASKASKPALKYNIIVPILSTLVGNEQLNRKRARMKPTDIESVPLCDIYESRWNALVDEQELEDKIQVAFMDALCTRMGGWVERTFKVNTDGYLDFEYSIPNNMRIFVDPETRSSDYKLERCRWIIKEAWEPLDIIKEKYHIKKDNIKTESDMKWYNQLAQAFQRFTNKDYTSNAGGYDKENDRYKLLEFQERVTRRMINVFDGENFFKVTEEDYSKMKDELQMVSETHEDAIAVTIVLPYFEDLIVFHKVLDQPAPNFDVFPVFSYNNNIQITEQASLVDLLIDVQDDINKAKSQARDYITQMLSGGVFIDKREKDAIKQLRQKGNQPNQVYELNNPTVMPQKMPPGNIPPDVLNNAENSFNYANRVSLISEAMRGETARSGESGVLFEQKVQRAAAAINPYFKNVSRLRKALAEDFVDNFAYAYAETDRTVLLKIGQQHVYSQQLINLSYGSQIINNMNNASLFVELDEGDDNITSKEDNFQRMLALVNIISQINPQFVDIKSLLESAPVTGADKMIAYIDNMLQAQAQSAETQGAKEEQFEQLELTKKALDNMKIQRGMVTEQEKLKLDAAKLQIDAEKGGE